MDIEFYNNIKNIFISIRAEYSKKISKEKKYENFLYYKSIFAPYYHQLKLSANEDHNYVLVYCIEALLDLMDEGDCTKINLFADAIHNMPEICLQIRPVHTFEYEITEFRNKYGKNYFPFYI